MLRSVGALRLRRHSAGDRTHGLIPQWREKGYFVTLVFIRLSDVEMSLNRVAERVRRGGHGIPEEVIRRRFPSALPTLSGFTEDL
jgi:predicted ABC-type ATPase